MERAVAKLVALIFDDEFKAEEARVALIRMGILDLLESEETALIARGANGRARMSHDVAVTPPEAGTGRVVAIAAAAATATIPEIHTGPGAARSTDILTGCASTRAFILDLRKELRAGTSALVLLASSDAERRRALLDRLRRWDARMLQSDLPPDVIEAIAVAGPPV
jgi:uncharacterized membrane protein